MARRRTFATTALLALLLFAAPESAAASEGIAPLFAVNETLEIDFELNLSALCLNPRRKPCRPVPGIIRYTSDTGQRVELDVTVRTRGRWHRNSSACAVPALFIDFDPDHVDGTLFAGQGTLPFTSHCRHKVRRYHIYALKEYLAYRLYNVVSPDSLGVRLARVSYIDDGKLRYRRYGFFSEHFNHAAARLGAERVDAERIDPRVTDPNELAILSVFQYMIGNLDWSAIAQHNVALLRRDNGVVFGLPYDFDYAGLVNAEYATPPPLANLHTVRKRLYRGFCRTDIDWEKVFLHFAGRRQAILQLAAGVDGLKETHRRSVQNYLEQFFEIIDSPKQRRRNIVDNCRKMPEPTAAAEGSS